MTRIKTTWTAQTKSQLVAALARKGYDRIEVPNAADRAVENGFAWAWGRLAGALCMALVTFSDTEVDMWDASLHTEAEVSCNVCDTMAHAPATLTQVDGIGNACRYCMRDIPGHIEHITKVVAEGKVDVERGDEMIAALRNLAAHVGVELPASPFVVDPQNPTDDELAAAIERGLASGSLITAEEFLAQLDGPHITPHTFRHPNGIVQVFRSAADDHSTTTIPAIGAYQLHQVGQVFTGQQEYRTYNVDGSSLGVYVTEAEAFRAVYDNDGRYDLNS